MKPLIDFLVADPISYAAFTTCAADSAAAALAHKGGTAPTDKTDKQVSGNEKWGHEVSIFGITVALSNLTSFPPKLGRIRLRLRLLSV
jgi:hypothetical protein